MARLAGYQPQYFPRLHYFARILDSDIFTVSDYLQYVRKHAFAHKDGTTSRGVSYQAHMPIKTAQGVHMLGIPVERDQFQTIREAKIDYSTPWYEKHLNIIEQNYKKTPNFNRLYPEIACLLTVRHASLADLTVGTIIWGLSTLFEQPLGPRRDNTEELNKVLPQEPFRLKKFIILSEHTILPPDKTKGRDANEWLIDQCKTLGANEYYFGGTSAAAYMDPARFKSAGIKLVEQNWRCPPYRQRYGKFAPNLSILDLLMNVSPAEAREILMTRNS